MVIHTTKSHYVVINPSPSHTSLSIAGKELKEATFTKLLGLTFNNNLTWGNHVSSITAKILQNLRLLFNIRHLIGFKTAIKYYNNFIHPYLTYGISLYYPLSPLTLTKPLHILQNRTLRLVCGSQQKRKKTLSNLFIAHSTNVLPLPHLSTYFACVCAHSIKLRQCPPYLYELFTGIRKTCYKH